MAAFKTAYLQRAVALDVAVDATVQANDASNTALAKAFAVRQAAPEAVTAVKVGDLVVLSPGSVNSIKRTLSLAAATHLVAQSDNTMEYGHIPVENRDYRYFPMVNGTGIINSLSANVLWAASGDYAVGRIIKNDSTSDITVATSSSATKTIAPGEVWYVATKTSTTSITLAPFTDVKKVNLYKIVDKNDVLIDASQSETA